NPLLGPLADNGGFTLPDGSTIRTHALLAGSPAVNAGSNTLALAADQRGAGFVRVIGAAADVGAFEKQTLPPPPATKVAAVTVNGGGTQRSNVTSLVVTFDSPPTFAGAPAVAFVLERFVGGFGTGTFVGLAAAVSGNQVTLTFSGALAEAGPGSPQ